MIPKIKKIKKAIKKTLDIGEQAFLKQDGKFLSRRRKHVYARQLLAYFTFIYFKTFTLDRISFETKLFYNHASILYCKAMIENMLTYDKHTIADVDSIHKIVKDEGRKEEKLMYELKDSILENDHYTSFDLLNELYGFDLHLKQTQS